jgi:rhodanese-related sulfurtransferase
VLLDVSPAEEFADWHAKGSLSAPSVRYGVANDLRSALRTAAFASLSVKPTEEVPREEFLAAAGAALGGTAAGVVVACAAGGALRPTVNFPAGQASRSLFAAAALISSGAVPPARVAHLSGGLSSWFKDGGEGEGAGLEWDVRKGRVPSVGGPMYDQDAPELM